MVSVYSGGTASAAAWGMFGGAVTTGQAATVIALGGAFSGAMMTGSADGALQGAFTGLAFYGIGSFIRGAEWAQAAQGAEGVLGTGLNGVGYAASVGAHGLLGGVVSELQGGKFGHGFAAAGFGKLVTPAAINIFPDNVYGQAVMVSIVGGTASELSGGKFANGAATAAMAFAFNQMQQESQSQQIGANPLTPGELYVDVLSRPLDSDLGDIGFKHNALFIFTVDEAGTFEIVKQYSLEFGGTEFLPQDSLDNSTFMADRQAFLNRSRNVRFYSVTRPDGQTWTQFSKSVIEQADAYIAPRYNPVMGPNSNTAAIAPIYRAGGRINRRVSGAVAQCWKLPC